MRATAKEFVPEEVEMIMNESKNEVESDKVETQEWKTPLKYVRLKTMQKNDKNMRKHNNNKRYEVLKDETEHNKERDKKNPLTAKKKNHLTQKKEKVNAKNTANEEKVNEKIRLMSKKKNHAQQ